MLQIFVLDSLISKFHENVNEKDNILAKIIVDCFNAECEYV